MSKKLVRWHAETNVGTVSEKAFFGDLPENLTKDTFQAVDEYREKQLSRAMTESMDHAEKIGVGDGSGTGVSVPEIPMGGQAVGHVHIDPSFKVVGEVTYTQSDIMKAVIDRSSSLFDQHNNQPALEEAEEA